VPSDRRSDEVTGDQVGRLAGRHDPADEGSLPRPRELERLASARVLDVRDEGGPVPGREDSPDPRLAQTRLVLENPYAIAGKCENTMRGSVAGQSCRCRRVDQDSDPTLAQARNLRGRSTPPGKEGGPAEGGPYSAAPPPAEQEPAKESSGCEARGPHVVVLAERPNSTDHHHQNRQAAEEHDEAPEQQPPQDEPEGKDLEEQGGGIPVSHATESTARSDGSSSL
jgi:hypothetical protein